VIEGDLNTKIIVISKKNFSINFYKLQLFSITILIMEPTKEKRTRQMTPELLEKLALARKKANEKRTENAKLKKMEKELKVKEQQTKAQEIKEKL
jgi:hypothetical protein